MFTLIIFIIVLSILIFVHEFGHFVVAKRAGMKVEEFGFGFPPRLWGIKRGGTVYSINWIPFGGFVKIFGEDGQGKSDRRSFASAKARVRVAIVVAGVAMNFLLAVVLLSIGNAVGLRVGLIDEAQIQQAKDVKVQIIQVAAGSPAEKAGLLILDEIVGFRVGGKETRVKGVEEVQDFVSRNKGREITIVLRSGNQQKEKILIPRADPPAGEGALGVSLATTGVIKYPWYQAVNRGATDSVSALQVTAMGYAGIIKSLFTTGKTGAEISGPIGIAVITGQAARLGFSYLLQFVAIISINLMVLNIIPFPALDGGRLLFIGIEKIKGKPVSQKIENAVNTFGFALLILLMIYVTTKDIVKFFNF
jgi:regulator of sigma E protease